MKFRKLPVEVEAVRFTGHNWAEVQQFTGDLFTAREPEERYDELRAEVWDKLHDTWVGVKTGQWVIRGTKREFYPCEDDGTGAAPLNYERIES